MQTKTLFSEHYLRHHLPDHPQWDEDPRPAFDAVRELWQKARRHGDTWNEAQTEQEFIQLMLDLLDWSYVVQPQAHQGGRVTRPDYALFPDEAAKAKAMPHQGQDDAFYSRARAIGEAKYWGRPLSQKHASGREIWKPGNPSHQMVSYLVGTRVAWGILTNGLIWRLYSREVSSTASEFYQVDLGLIFDFLPQGGAPTAVQLDQFRRWWLFFRRASFEPDSQGRSFVQRVHEGSATYAREISDKLKELVYEEVMPEIAGGFVAYRYHELGVRGETDDALRIIYRASLSLLYKLLFLLYAEARALLPVDNPGYREQSLTMLAQWAAGRLDGHRALSDAPHATPRYDALLALFHRIDRGDPGLGIPRYNGGLFDPSSPENQFLEEHRLSDRAVARSVDILVRDAGQPVDYGYIGVRNLGAIYEGLLENRLRVVDAAAGRVELIGDKGERKATGSYYTPDYIVEYIVQHALDPILEQRDDAFRAAMDRCADLRQKLKNVSDTTTARRLRGELGAAERDAREAFLGIKVLDPSMGSGHFLVNAVDHLTDAIIRRMQVYHDEHPHVRWEWNPIQRLIEQVRGEILAEMERQRIPVGAGRLDDTALLTRLVMKRCIYGVDLNRMAVELAKVSLWLHTFTVGAPLSFLDHHLRWGNSLIGTDVRTVERAVAMTESGQMSLFEGPFAGLLDLTGLMIEVVERADATLADVRHSAEMFDRFQEELIPYKRVLDLWVSQHFANQGADEFLTVHGADVLPALKGKRDVPQEYEETIARARELWEEKRFFHWDLEFPEVFIDLQNRDWAENPGFDAVIGNPPWLGVRTGEIFSDLLGWMRQSFVAAVGQFDLAAVFLELSVHLIVRRGRVGLVIPKRIATNESYADLRELVAVDTPLVSAIDLGVAFEGVNNDALILITGFPASDALYFGVRQGDSEVRTWQVKTSVLDSMPFYIIPVNSRAGEIDLVEKVTSVPHIPLDDLVSIVRGAECGMNHPAIHQDPDRQGLMLVDHLDVNRYGVHYTGWKIDPSKISPSKLKPISVYQEAPKLLARFLSAELVVGRDNVGYASTNLVYHIHLLEQVDLSLDFLLAVMCSHLLSFWYRVAFQNEEVKFPHVQKSHLASIPICRIAFTTLPEERERLVAVGTAEAAEWIERAEKTSAKSVTFSAFSDSNLGRWLDACLSADPEQSDVVHDLLAHLAERMIERHKQRQRLDVALDPFKYLDRGAPFVKLPDAFADEIKYGQRLSQPVDLGEVHHDVDRLRLAPSGDAWELQVQLKQRDPEDGWRSWQYDEGGNQIARAWVPAYRLPLSPTKARYYQQALPVLSEFAEARSFPGGYTRSTAKKLQLTRVPAFDPDADLAPLVQLSDELAQVQSRIAATDRLIDLIVYRLYGLTADDVAVVEGQA